MHTGQVKLSRTMPSGRQRLLRVIGPGETLGEHSFLTGGATQDQAEALTSTRLCAFSHGDLAGLVADHPSIALQMLRSQSDRMAEAERRLALSTLDVDVRVADYLLEQPLLHSASGSPAAGGSGTAGSQVQLPMSKKDVASMLGTTPESFSRGMARLTSLGLIAVQSDVVTLMDPEGLEDMVARA